MSLPGNPNGGGYPPPPNGGYPPMQGGRLYPNTYPRPAGGVYPRPGNFPTSPLTSGGATVPNAPSSGGLAGADHNKVQNDAYKKAQIETATPENLILMLYDGALRFMGQAEEAFKEKNLEKISNLLLRIQAIFTELMTSLDKEKGGDIATNLERLYLFFLRQLTDANIKKDPAPMLAIKPLVQDLRNTWEQAMQINQQTQQVKTQPVTARPRLNFTA